MAAASASNAETIVSGAIALSAEQSLDTALLGNAPPSASAPAGILNGVTPIASAGTKAAEGIADDLGLLAGAIRANGINPDSMVVICAPSLAVKIRTPASPKLTNEIRSSSSLAAGVVIGIGAGGLVTGYSGGVEVSASEEATLNFESTTPAEIVSSAGVPASPTFNAWQMDMSVLKITGDVAWTVHPGAVAQVTGAAWW
jgi:hypothetical protein